jgi:DNA-binding transcriptional MocR family regulator
MPHTKKKMTKATSTKTNAETIKYRGVADRVQGLIEDGTLRPGDRIPSVRRLHRQWSVSVTTVLEAYRLLEDRGYVQARPRSGYFVRPNPRAVVQEAETIEPPRRAQRVRTDLMMRLHAEINTPGFVRLGAAAPDLDLLPHRVLARKVAEVMRRHPRTCHSYMTGPGYEGLRRAVARRMVDAGCAVGPADVVITNGAQEALFLALRAVTRPGQMVAVESPCYFGLLEILEGLHLKALEVRTDPQHGIDLEALDLALGRRSVAACAVVSNYSNPLGCCMDEAKKRALVELLERHDVPLIEDDIYGELPFEGPRPSAVKAFDEQGRVLYVSSFSKTISPGFRVGWMVPGRAFEGALWLKNISSIAAPSIPQLALAAYLDEGGYDRHLRGLRRVYRDNLARAIDAIGRYFPPDSRATRPQGGQLLWVQLPRQVSSTLLYEQVREHKISVAPGDLFSASGHYGHCLRLNLALRYDDRVDHALQTLGRLASAQLQ